MKGTIHAEQMLDADDRPTRVEDCKQACASIRASQETPQNAALYAVALVLPGEVSGQVVPEFGALRVLRPGVLRVRGRGGGRVAGTVARVSVNIPDAYRDERFHTRTDKHTG